MIDREEAEIGHIKFYCIEKEIETKLYCPVVL